MKRSTGEWIDKAEGDYRSAGKLLAGESPECDQVCFFAQQCAEKYIKALLNERDRAFPKTHDLKELVELLSPPDSALGGTEAVAGAAEPMVSVGPLSRFLCKC